MGEDAFAAMDPNGSVPPNMRRESSAAWSEADSEVLLVDQMDKDQPQQHRSRWGR